MSKEVPLDQRETIGPKEFQLHRFPDYKPENLKAYVVGAIRKLFAEHGTNKEGLDLLSVESETTVIVAVRRALPTHMQSVSHDKLLKAFHAVVREILQENLPKNLANTTRRVHFIYPPNEQAAAA